MIGFFGGSFDPIHLGHINLAIQLLETCGLESILFCPAKISPHKIIPPISDQHRLSMLQLAIQDIPQFQRTDREILRDGPSYTYDTLKELINEKPNSIALLLGEDSLLHFHTWYKVEEIIDMVPIIVGLRSSFPILTQLDNSKISEAIKEGMVKTNIMEISSTEIRERLRKKMYCGHLLPAKVMDYIYTNDLYS